MSKSRVPSNTDSRTTFQSYFSHACGRDHTNSFGVHAKKNLKLCVGIIACTLDCPEMMCEGRKHAVHNSRVLNKRAGTQGVYHSCKHSDCLNKHDITTTTAVLKLPHACYMLMTTFRLFVHSIPKFKIPGKNWPETVNV